VDVWQVRTQIRDTLSIGNHVISRLKRGEDGRFKDSELAELIKNAYVRKFMRGVVIDGMLGSSIQRPLSVPVAPRIP